MTVCATCGQPLERWAELDEHDRLHHPACLSPCSALPHSPDPEADQAQRFVTISAARFGGRS